ncbi:MAG: hypothetical protein GMKNLPBB_01081 [Myxococcota bacterium]|nr:hypothetical protein [Myxococcota bacterium]
MNFRKQITSDSGDDEINLTPMIDIVFQLLIFFMVTSSFSNAVSNPSQQVSTIDVELPRASARGAAMPSDAAVVVLHEDGSLIYRNQLTSLSALEEDLKRLAKDKPGAPLVVQSDEKVPHGRVVKVMDLAKLSGIRTISIATEAK